MFKIAICDDEIENGAQLEKMIREITASYSLEIELDLFFSGEGLCAYLENENVYDLIFLDIELRTTDGIKVGKIIRKNHGTEVTQIVYISAKQEYALQLFKMRPLDFLIKPIAEEAVEEVLKSVFKMVEKNKTELFEYQFRKQFFKIPISNILYFESANRKVFIHGIEKEEEFYGTLKDTFEKVNGFTFIWIHKSYLVNMSFVSKFEYDQVTLQNGCILPISQAKRSQVRNIVMKQNKAGIKV